MLEEISIFIREATPADIIFLADVERSAAQIFNKVATHSWLTKCEVQSPALHESYIQAKNSWVAVHDDIPVGFINGVEINQSFHICELSVTEAWQQQGVGRALLTTVEQVMRERGLSSITLTTFRNMPWNAPFYMTQGFVELSDHELTPFLMDVLDEEIEAGFEPHTRSAMQKTL